MERIAWTILIIAFIIIIITILFLAVAVPLSIRMAMSHTNQCSSEGIRVLSAFGSPRS